MNITKLIIILLQILHDANKAAKKFSHALNHHAVQGSPTSL